MSSARHTCWQRLLSKDETLQAPGTELVRRWFASESP